jgi:geranylgeranyl pyrophosphate synthase
MTVSILQTLFAPVQEELKQVEELLCEVEPNQHSAITKATDHLLSSGGKRVRPALALMVAKAFDAPRDRAVALAAAVELLHTATLVHDDVIDGALLRRGNPTLNAMWSPSATILTGDFLFARAASLAARTEHIPVMKLFARALMTIVNGEISQLLGETSTDEIFEDYYQRIRAKTATLFMVCAEAGAMLGKASDNDVDAMRRFGHMMGMAFQVVDDVFDFVSTPEQLGKPVGDDLRRGVLTLPTILFMRAHPDHETLRDLLNGNLQDDPALDSLIEEIRTSPAIEQAMDEARSFIAEGQQVLDVLPDEEIRQTLVQLAAFIVERDR